MPCFAGSGGAPVDTYFFLTPMLVCLFLEILATGTGEQAVHQPCSPVSLAPGRKRVGVHWSLDVR